MGILWHWCCNLYKFGLWSNLQTLRDRPVSSFCTWALWSKIYKILQIGITADRDNILLCFLHLHSFCLSRGLSHINWSWNILSTHYRRNTLTFLSEHASLFLLSILIVKLLVFHSNNCRIAGMWMSWELRCRIISINLRCFFLRKLSKCLRPIRCILTRWTYYSSIVWITILLHTTSIIISFLLITTILGSHLSLNITWLSWLFFCLDLLLVLLFVVIYHVSE